MLPHHRPFITQRHKMNKSTKKRPLLLKALKWTGISLACIVALILAIITVGVWILTPSRLTPIINNVANENLNADFSLARAEISFWKTFPGLFIELDSLTIKTKAFDDISPEQRQTLPPGADTVVHVDRFRGGVNLLPLITGKIALRDVALSGARLNAVVLDSLHASYDILPPADNDSVDSSSTTSLPDISINLFAITDSLPIAYYSVPDTLDLRLTLHRSDVIARDNPAYRLSLSSNLDALLPPDVKIGTLPLSIDGKIEWQHSSPDRFLFRDFIFALSPIKAVANASLTLSDPPVVDELDVAVNSLPVMECVDMLPQQWAPQLPPIKTDMVLNARASLTRPYRLDDGALPYLDITVEVPRCSAVYDGYTISSLSMKAAAAVNGADLDASTLNLSSLSINGDGASVNLNATVTYPLSDPLIDGHLTAEVELGRLPKSILSMVPGTVKGLIELDTDLLTRVSDFNPNRFHRIRLNGDVDLLNLALSSPDIGIDIFTRKTCFKFGTNDNFVADTHRVDSLLTASLSVDTLSMQVEGLLLSLNDLKGGVGCSNKLSSADTTTVTPMGATVKVGRLHYASDDSTRIHLRDFSAKASLKRFQNEAKVPLLNLNAIIGSIIYADSMNRAIIRKGNLDFTAHMRKAKGMNARYKQTYDSIAAIYPDASPDSLMRILRRSTPRVDRDNLADYDMIDFGIDGSTKRLLRTWEASGSLSAERARVFTPYFPLRNRLSNIDVKFSTDSVIFNDVKCKIGKSDFRVNGGLRDIRRALTLRKPLQLLLNVKSDTLNVNELVQASYNGAAFAEQIKDGSVTLASIESESQLDRLADSVSADGVTAALLVPVNIGADIAMHAANIIYSDILMTDFNGELLVKEGAVNLRDLSAKSGIGNAKMTALYTAPTKDDIHFGFGMELTDINIKEFIGMMPAVDSLMPLLQSFEGKINADIAATADIDSLMNIDLPSLNAAMKLDGRDLVLLDAETFRTISKWLLFKDKKTNVIPQMTIEMLIRDSKVELFPFVFDFDRYRLAVMGSNDLAMNFKYHVSVLKSPIPFKFGINLSGNADKMKVRLGRAKYKPNQAGETIAIVDTTRINLLKEIDNVFSRGARKARLGSLTPDKTPDKVDFDELNDTISSEDSTLFINQGLLPAPPAPVVDQPVDNKNKKKKK